MAITVPRMVLKIGTRDQVKVKAHELINDSLLHSKRVNECMDFLLMTFRTIHFMLITYIPQTCLLIYIYNPCI